MISTSGTMTYLAQLLLVLTSLSPVGLVYAGVLLDAGNSTQALSIGAAAFFLLALCLLLLLGAKSLSSTPMEVSDVEPKEGESLSFLVAYALPLIALEHPAAPVPTGLAVFALMMAIIVWRQQSFHVNPVLSLIGYRFFSARNDSNARILVLSRRKTLPPGTVLITMLSDYLWLDAGESRDKDREGRGHGLLASETSRRDDPEDPR